MRGIIIYQGKYGATEQYAQWLADALRLPLLKAENATPAILAGYELVILGSSVYIGKLTIGNWLKQNLGILAAKKKLLLFIVCGTTVDDAAQQKLIIQNNLDAAIRAATEVFFLPGRCVVAKLAWGDRIMLKLGAWLENDPKKKAVMNKGFDNMDAKHLEGVKASILRLVTRVPVC
nr:flavodoxin domain-containing protein [uncultured Mucilaginibacter sp.]